MDIGEYGKKFSIFEKALEYDQANGKFGIRNWTNDKNISFGDNIVTFTFKETDIPLNQDRNYYVYMWTYWRGHSYPDYLVASINVKDQLLTITPNDTGKNEGNIGSTTPTNPPAPTKAPAPTNTPVPTKAPVPTNTPAPVVNSVPKTGDETPLMMLAALMAMSAAGVYVFMRRRSA